MSLTSVPLHPVTGLAVLPLAAPMLRLLRDWLSGLSRWGLALSTAECTAHLDVIDDASGETTGNVPRKS